MSLDATGSTRTIEWLAWFEVNKKKLLVAALALAILGGLFALYRVREEASEREAWSAFFKVARPGSRSDQDGAIPAQSYLDVATAHPRRAAGVQAQLFAARALFEQGKYAEARMQFEEFIRRNGESEFAGTAALGIAASLDSENKINEAVAAYQGVVAQYPNSGVSSQSKLALARIHESRGDAVQALKIYEELARPTSQSAWGADAAMRREDLLQAHPELVATNSIPAPVSATATNVIRVLSSNPPAARP